MKIQLADLIDKMSIVRLKIERVGESHLREEYEECERAIEEYRRQGVEVKPEWFDRLYDINGRIWDLDFRIRDYVNREIEDIDRYELRKIGEDALRIMDLMKARVDVKNAVAEETRTGFKEIKIDHVSS